MSTPIFNANAAFATVYTQQGIFFYQNGAYFTNAYVYVGATLPALASAMSSQRSDQVSILGGFIDGVTLGSNVTVDGGAAPTGPAGGDLTGNYPNPTVKTITNALTLYNGDALVANGLPGVIAQVNQVAQAANIGSTTLFAVPAAAGGMYRVSAYAVETTADAASSTLPSIGIGWTDFDSGVALLANTVTSTNPANAVGAFGQGVQVIYAKGGTNITYQTSNYASGTAGAMKYSVHIRLERIG